MCLRSILFSSRSTSRLPVRAGDSKALRQVAVRAKESAISVRRRQLIATTGLFLTPQLRLAGDAAEGDVRFLEPGASVVGRFVEKANGWQTFETLDFQLEVPPDFNFVEAPKQAAPPGRGRAAPPSAIKAIFVDSEDRNVTVVEYSGSQIKPTFFQIGDISQFGSPAEVAKLLTPPGATVLSTGKTVVEQPERDTGTVRGKVKATPQTIYRYEYQLGSGMHVATAAIARAGKVLLAGGVAPSEQWDAQPETLRRVVESFQLSFPN